MTDEERKMELDSEYDGCDQTGCMKALKKLFGAMLFGLLIFSCAKVATNKHSSQNDHDTTTTPILDHPNVIVILADDVGYECLTCNGGQTYQTPNLDLMALHGRRFTQCHSCPNCSPSRQQIATGKYNFRNYTCWGIMNPQEKTFGNMFRDAGYNTLWAGKDQLDGGGASAYNWGYNQYLLYNPFTIVGDTDELAGGSRYKNPRLYAGQNGSGDYLDSASMAGKYGEDVLADTVIAFMNKDNTKPFFIFYTMVNSHPPFQPTPDDANYNTFNGGSHPEYYPSMIKYMDKKVGEILHAVDSLGLAENTIIYFLADNGTPGNIISIFNGEIIKGGKGTTLETGTHVPFIIQWLNPAFATGVDTDLIDFTDFLPTLADMAGISKPDDYGILDGQSFYSGAKRQSIFFSYQKNPEFNSQKIWWAQDHTYKKYDSLFADPSYKIGALFRISQYKERIPNVITNLNYFQKIADNYLYNVIQSYK